MTPFSLRFVCSLALVTSLAACGGGGSDGDGGDRATSNDSDIRGTWVFASAGNRTGNTCGLDQNGDLEERSTITFNENTFSVKFETCNIVSGNTGTFVEDGAGSGSYKTGGAYLTVGIYQLKELNITITTAASSETIYGGYNVTSNELRMTDDDGGTTGGSPDNRESALASEVFFKQ